MLTPETLAAFGAASGAASSADFSGFEPQRLHAAGALASVWEATARDGRPGRFALKIFHPPRSTNVRRFYAIEGWLLAVERQRLAAQRHRVAVEVLALGRCEEGAFVVLPWLERPLEPLIDTLGAKGDRLRALANQLLVSLAAWDEQFGGPHGRLAPSNIFLAPGPLAQAAVQFSDPWFAPGAKERELRTRDFNAIGAILVQIVRRRQAAGWPIEDAPEWRALGRAGRGWREFCNYLLNPQPADGELSIGEAQKRLARIPRDARPARTAALVGAGVLVLAAGSVTGYARFADPQGMPRNLRLLAEATGNPRAFRQEIGPEWALLCRAWIAWLGDVQRNGDRWERTGELWLPDDPLRAALREFRASADRLRPQALVPAAARESRLGLLADAPPPEVLKELLRGTVADRVAEAWIQVDALAGQLAGWPRWEEARRLQAELETRGLTRLAAAWQSRLPPAPPPDGAPVDVAGLLAPLNQLSLDDAGSLLLASRWGEIARISADMAASGDRIQAAMPRLALAGLRDGSSLGEFADSLAAPLEELRRRRGQFLDTPVVRERFLGEAPLLRETGEVTPADIARWQEELAAFSRVPPAEDPRASVDFDGRVSRLTSSAADLENEAPPGLVDGFVALSRADFDRELAQLRGTLQALRARVVVRRDAPAVAGEVGELSSAFRTLEQRLEATLASLRPELWLNRVGAQTWQLAASRERWGEWRQRALSGVAAAALERDRARFRTLREQERTLRSWLDGLEGADGFDVARPPALDGLAAETAEALRQLEASRREIAAAAVAAAQSWRDALPTTSWSATPAAVREPLAAHQRWREQLPAFGAELERLAGLLSQGFAWSEGVADVFAQITARAGVDALAGAPAERIAEARRLSQLASSDDRAALSSAAQGGGLSVQLTAWRRLGGLADWPASGELDVEAQLQTSMRASIARDVTATDRRESLLAELTREALRRWRIAWRGARDEATVERVLARREDFGVREEDLAGAERVNVELHRLKQRDWGAVLPDEISGARDEAVARLRRFAGADVAPEFAAWLQKLIELELVVPKGEQADIRKLGPGRTGWTGVLPRDDRLVEFRWEGAPPFVNGVRLTAEEWQAARGAASSPVGSLKLTFTLVEAPGVDPFFLATTELPVGCVAALSAPGSPVVAQLLEALGEDFAVGGLINPAGDLRIGPQTWSIRLVRTGERKPYVLPTVAWIGNRQPSWPAPPDGDSGPYASGSALFPAATADGSPSDSRVAAPGPEAPLNFVPARIARSIAEQVFGCRLPSPEEWRALAALGLLDPAKQNRAANLRDAGWRRERDRLIDSGVIASQLPLDADIFWPQSLGFRARGRDARIASEQDDGVLWFAPIAAGSARIEHLLGNVAEFLYDEAANRFFVAGGSALSPPELDPATPYPIEAMHVFSGFSDVGVRLAFSAPGAVVGRNRLIRLIRDQPYVRY